MWDNGVAAADNQVDIQNQNQIICCDADIDQCICVSKKQNK